MGATKKATEVTCPTCGATPGSRCVKVSATARSWVVDANGALAGQWKKTPHPERGAAARGVPVDPAGLARFK